MEIHLSALENVSCWAFRKLCKGATDSYTGILSLTNLIKRNNAWKEIDTYPIKDQRQWIQISTSKLEECSQFIKRLEEELKNEPEKDNVYGMQLNASSPSARLIQIGQGPALIKRTTKVSNLIKELLKQNKFKVGIKVRLGLNVGEVKQRKILNLFEELEKIEDPNFTRVTVHFKHAKQTSEEGYDYSLLKELASYSLPLIINGGIRTPKDIKVLEDISDSRNIAGIMIGREAMKNPDCLTGFSNELNKTLLAPRNFSQIKKEFAELCKKHTPKPIYMETIKEYCTWAR